MFRKKYHGTPEIGVIQEGFRDQNPPLSGNLVVVDAEKIYIQFHISVGNRLQYIQKQYKYNTSWIGFSLFK
jgi:hypothetical protein